MKKLNLSKETLLVLSEDEAAGLHAGAVATGQVTCNGGKTCSVQVCSEKTCATPCPVYTVLVCPTETA